jgi:hypothetical protein
MAKVKTDADALRTVPPRDFIQARTALVERLTKAGTPRRPGESAGYAAQVQWYGRSTEWLRATRMTSEP